MEGELVSGQPSDMGAGEKPAPCYNKIFWECLPMYLSIGMSPDEYWNGDSELARAYREAHKIKLKQENEMLWLSGMYVYQSILLCAPRLNTLQPKEPLPYAKKPFDIFIEEKKSASVNAENDPAFMKVKAWMERNNKKWQK